MEIALPSNRLWMLLATASLLGACASVPDDRGMPDVQALVSARGGPALPAHGDVPTVAGRTLSASEAVQVALARNPRLRLGYAQLGFAGAEIYEAGRLSNPTLSLSVLDPSTVGAANQLTIGLAQNFTNLLMMPARSRIAAGEFESAKALVGAEVLTLASDVEAAYYTLVGARQVAEMRGAILQVARASADLAQRYYDAGNIDELALSLQRAEASQAELDLIAARREVAEARNALATLLGVTAADGEWQVPDRLPLPPPEDDALPELQTLAAANRLDLAAARKDLELARSGADMTRGFRYLGELELGVERERETDGTRLTGPTLSWAIPLFHQNQGGVLRAEARHETAEARLRAMEIEASNQIDLAHHRLAAARAAVEEFRTRMVPLRENAVARMQERVNYMLSGIFDLIRLKQDEYRAYQGYLDSVRDYWTARAALGRLVGTQLPSTALIGGEAVAPPVPAPGETPANDHSHHH
jgi:cobalt-zinc-cadmium efflux system outer membrane protein